MGLFALNFTSAQSLYALYVNNHQNHINYENERTLFRLKPICNPNFLK